MQAVVLNRQPKGHQQLRVVNDYASPQPPPGEVRIRTTLAGICNTDLEIVQGYAGFHGVLGHEFVGVVDQAEDPAMVDQRIVQLDRPASLVEAPANDVVAELLGLPPGDGGAG